MSKYTQFFERFGPGVSILAFAFIVRGQAAVSAGHTPAIIGAPTASMFSSTLLSKENLWGHVTCYSFLLIVCCLYLFQKLQATWGGVVCAAAFLASCYCIFDVVVSVESALVRPYPLGAKNLWEEPLLLSIFWQFLQFPLSFLIGIGIMAISLQPGKSVVGRGEEKTS